ncbi:hypothetical protein [Bosea sp. (in: a-proteobacteria)]|uniref:hypothetical protein n=1 Tax=Bosea sp. (in: a-proteobacteria) TaxID=1871050 RepID=UPI001ACB9872|nr:hypothetical protein [Bosea sp. (in: a-proteobacteria)]MBN9437764.1 hypothetical protein [Bosea sp. (in: a-proteobacteria)]
MFTIAHKHRWLTALAAPIIGAVLLGTPKAEAPTAPEPHLVAAQHSPTGKIIDRLPGGAPTTPPFAPQFVRSDWARAISPAGAMLLVSDTATDVSALATAAVSKPAPATATASARPQQARMILATLPPKRPASLVLPQGAAEVATAREKRPSVTSQMIALVGSLAARVNPL